jgi:TATA-box binding protein (TBP) (component of TFIID and TFIIIB)
METVICKICNCPTFMCLCESENGLEGKLDTLNGVNYTSISISTMTVCFNFNQFINLNLLKEKLPEKLKVTFNPDSKKSKVKKKKGTDSFYNSFDIKLTFVDIINGKPLFSNVSIFIFPNGRVKAAGVKTQNTINIMIEELIYLINYVPCTVEFPDNLLAENIKIQMICSDFKIKPIKDDPDGWCLKQEDLKNIIVKKGYSATFSSLSRYPGINVKYPSVVEKDKNVSLLIFRSGSIIITGAKNIKDISTSYTFITDIISKNSKVLFYYDINEEIKQKKLKKIKKN